MTRTQREMLVDRYLSGEMNAIEEQEFFMIVATDNELLQTLRAHRLVERALRHDRDTLPVGYVAVQERALALLALTPRTTSTTELTPSAGSAGGGTAGGNWFAGSQIVTWVTVASTAIVFSVIGFIGRGIVPTSASDTMRQAHPDTLVMSPAPIEISSPPLPMHDDTIVVATSIESDAMPSATTTMGEVATSTKTPQSPLRRITSANDGTYLRTSDSGSDEVRYDSTIVRRQPVAAQRRDSIPSVAAGTEKIPQLPPESDSITMRAKITLPQGPEAKKR